MPPSDRDPRASVPPADPAFDAADDLYEMAPDELAACRRGPNPPVLVDVREPWEHAVARIEGARLVPLGTIPAALSTFDPAQDYVLYCHHGVRSRNAAEFLRARGLTRVANLAGGIDRWSVEVDAGVPRY